MKDTCYLVIDERGVQALRKTRPDLSSGQVAIRLHVNVSDRFFHRAIPTAELTVPDDFVIEPMIEVELETPPSEEGE